VNNRRIDWDVDGLNVWCDDCRPKAQCEACEDAYELEQEWETYESNPYSTKSGAPSQPRPEGKR
jgi:hypothetical protein